MNIYTDEFWDEQANKLTDTSQILKLPWENKVNKVKNSDYNLQQETSLNDELYQQYKAEGIFIQNEGVAYRFMRRLSRYELYEKKNIHSEVYEIAAYVLKNGVYIIPFPDNSYESSYTGTVDGRFRIIPARNFFELPQAITTTPQKQHKQQDLCAYIHIHPNASSLSGADIRIAQDNILTVVALDGGNMTTDNDKVVYRNSYYTSKWVNFANIKLEARTTQEIYAGNYSFKCFANY